MKPCNILVGDNKELSRIVQELLFRKGAGWCDDLSGKDIQNVARYYGKEATIFVGIGKPGRLSYGPLGQDRAHRQVSCPTFIAATQLGPLLAYLEEPNDPEIKIGNYLVEFRESRIVVGCQEISAEKVKEVYDRLFDKQPTIRIEGHEVKFNGCLDSIEFRGITISRGQVKAIYNRLFNVGGVTAEDKELLRKLNP